MKKSKLIIQVPFRSQAQELKKEFDKRNDRNWIDTEICHGSLSDTYGVAIDFYSWFVAPYSFNQVILGGEIYKEITGDDWKEGRYLEGWEESYGKEAIEISYLELTTRGAKYYVDDIYLDLGSGKIYTTKGEFDSLLMTTTDISLLTCRENLKITPGILSGIEKLWRRGFLDMEEQQLSIL